MSALLARRSAAFLLPLWLLAAGCQRPNSILLIEVASAGDIHPTWFRVTITASLDSRALVVPPDAGAPLTLPISFTVELDRSHIAPVTVAIEAFDDTQSIVGCGSTVQRHIEVGGQTVIPVLMDPTCGQGTPPVDAGADDGGGAGLDAGAD